jgi:hypothetical protein
LRNVAVTIFRIVPGDSSVFPPRPPRYDSLATQVTGKQGKFHFKQLQRGIYLLRAVPRPRSGFSTAQQFVTAKIPRNAQDVIVHLLKQ